MKKIWIVALAAMLMLGSAAVAVAAESPTPQAKQQERAKKSADRPQKQERDFRLIHSDGVGIRKDGTTVETRFQKGIITEVNAGSITLKSPGNYVKTYKIDATTKVFEKRQPEAVSDLKVGEMAAVHAVKVGNDYIAKLINCVGEPGPKLKELLDKG